MTEPQTLAEYLDQDQVWMSKSGPFPIRDMDLVYRRRALRWLVRNAPSLHVLWMLSQYVDGDMPTLDTLIGWADQRPAAWIRETRLFKALVKGVPEELIP